MLWRHPTALDLMPEIFDAVPLRALWWQEGQLHAWWRSTSIGGAIARDVWTEALSRMTVSGLVTYLLNSAIKNRGIRGHYEDIPSLGVEDRTVRQQDGSDIDPLAPGRLDGMMSATGASPYRIKICRFPLLRKALSLGKNVVIYGAMNGRNQKGPPCRQKNISLSLGGDSFFDKSNLNLS